jgi:Rho family, other
MIGQEEFDRLRTLSYADTHVIMLCFSVESRDSLENVQEKWWDEIARHCDGTNTSPKHYNPWFSYGSILCVVWFALVCWVPVRCAGAFGLGADVWVGVKLVLVALKCDLRDDEVTKERLDKFGEKCISYEQGLTMAKTIKAVRYLGITPLPPNNHPPSYPFPNTSRNPTPPYTLRRL